MANSLVTDVTSGPYRHLYRYGSSKHLLRTPMSKSLTLTADEVAQYMVAGEYDGNANPIRGYSSERGQNLIEQNTFSGKEMRQDYLSPNYLQIWRNSSQMSEPPFVFYQGCYAPSSANPYGNAEAFLQIPAYHFTIPSTYDGWQVLGASISITVGGDLLTYGSATSQLVVGINNRDNYAMPYYASLAPTNRLDADDPWRNRYEQKLGVFDSLDNTINNMHTNATEWVEIDTNRSLAGGQIDDLYVVESGGRNISKHLGVFQHWWATYLTYPDGYIPISPNPWAQQITLSSASTLGRMSQYRDFWIVLTPDVATSGGSTDTRLTDYPTFHNNQNTYPYWLCSTWWGMRLSLNLVLL